MQHLLFRPFGIAVLCVSLLWISIDTEAATAQTQSPDRSKREAPAPDRETIVATAQWAVQLDPSVDPDAVAAGTGFRNLGQIGTLEGFYLFEKQSEVELPAGFEADAASVEWVNDGLDSAPGVRWFEQQVARRLVPLAEPTDPLYPGQWHLKNTGQSGGTAGQDVNVVPAWTAGYTGAGVTIAIVDDGLQHSHPDFIAKYVPSGSWDFNGGDADPNPVFLADEHGTAVGGVAAADDDGGKCGVGSAFGAGVSGIRLIADYTTDAQEASALTYAYQTNDVYNSSWGPGYWMAGPGPLTQLALEDGVAEGRSGMGSIYVFAAGNGLTDGSDVNYNGFANSRYTIAVGATDHDGVQSSYSEPGAAMLVNASSSGTTGITTTDRLGSAGYNGLADNDCTDLFGGTSSASPLVAGVVALMLDAKPDLTWRDVQHILVQTAEQNDPGDSDWTTNGAGLSINHKYGFGRVDAAAAVSAAVDWAGVQEESTVSTGVVGVGQEIPDNNPTGISSTIAIDSDMSLEHVEVVFDAAHTYRGDLRVVLTSPSGTESVLAELHNDPGDNYEKWKFMSVRHWGESPVGNWTLRVSDEYESLLGLFGFFESWELVLHGTRGAVSGTVTEVGSLIPLVGIDVSVVEAVSGEPVGSSVTDGSGAYAVGDLATGDYKVLFADHSGRHYPQWFGDAATFASATPVSVTLPSVTKNVDAAITVNDPPMVTDAAWSVPEDARPGALVGTVSASDSDSLSFSITEGNSGGAFAVDEVSGELTVAGALDHETAPSTTLTVSADDGLLTNTAAVTVTVTDVNEAPVASDGVWSVAEDAGAGTVLGTVAASDIDRDSLAFAITAGNEGGTFAIHSESGEVSVSGWLDYETVPRFVLTVSVSDGELSDTATVIVEVADVPEFVLPSSATFLDVPVGHLFFGDIEWMAWEGITKGCNPPGNSLYCPEDAVTRGQMAAFLHRALGDVLTPADPVQFTDDNGSVFEDDIEWLGATGITRGCNPPGNTLFCPDDPVTRGQMAAFLVRALGLTDRGVVDFVDDDASIFEADIEKLASAGITRGCNPPINDQFCPQDSVTRGQMAAFLYRALFR